MNGPSREEAGISISVVTAAPVMQREMASCDTMKPDEETIGYDGEGASSSDHWGSQCCSDPDHATEYCPKSSTELTCLGAEPSVVHSVLDEENGEVDQVMAKAGILHPNNGSALHEQGQCRPCAFVRSEMGCKAGHSCRFCHYEHVVPRQRFRPCKGKRIRIHKMLERLKYEVDAYIASGRPMFGMSDHLSSLELPPMVQNNETLRKMLFAHTLIHMEETYGFKLVESL